MSVDDIGLVDSIGRTSLQLFHRLGNGDDFWDVHKRVNVVFNYADLYHVQFMPGAAMIAQTRSSISGRIMGSRFFVLQMQWYRSWVNVLAIRRRLSGRYATRFNPFVLSVG